MRDKLGIINYMQRKKNGSLKLLEGLWYVYQGLALEMSKVYGVAHRSALLFFVCCCLKVGGGGGRVIGKEDVIERKLNYPCVCVWAMHSSRGLPFERGCVT